MNQALAAWQHTHPNADVHFVSITCDPDNDTPEALKKYAEHFKADPKRWTFLTGDMQAIQRIGQDSFKIAVVKGDHTDRACVVDRNGKVRGRFRLTEPDQAEMLDRLLTVVEAEQAGRVRASGDCRRARASRTSRLAADAPTTLTVAATPLSPAPPAGLPCSTVEQLPAVNATLNALAAVLLVIGWLLIKTRPGAGPPQHDAHGVRRLGGVSGLLPGLSLSRGQREVRRPRRRPGRLPGDSADARRAGGDGACSGR